MSNHILPSMRVIAAVFGAALLAPAQSTVPTSAVAASPTSLTFSYRLGSTAPGPQTVRITSSPDSVGFGAFANALTPVESGWLDVTPNEGSTPADLTVTVNPEGLPVGTYSGEVVIQAFATNSPLVVPVTFRVLPALAVAPQSLTFVSRVNGPTPAVQSFSVTSSGVPAPLSAVVSTTPAAPWLSVSPGTGTTPATFNVAVSPGALSPGTYNGTIRVPPTDTTSAFRDIPVSLTVLPPPSVTPASLTFTYRINGSTPSSRALNVFDGESSLPVSAQTLTTPAGGTWLTVAPPSGTTPATFNVGIAPAGLTAGTYNGTVRISATDSLGGFTDVPVTLTVLPAVTLAPASLSFVYRINGTTPAPQTFTPSSGAFTVPVTAVASTTPAGGTWLSVSPGTGSTLAPFTVSVSPSGLTAGTYTGTIRVTATDTSGGFVDLPVTLTVLSALSATPNALTFVHRAGGATPAAQTFSVSSGSGSTSVNVAGTVLTPAGGTWLSVSPASGATPAAFTVAVNPGALEPGTYTARIVVTGSSSDGQVEVPITLTVTSRVAVTPATLTFTHRIDLDPPASQTLTVSAGASSAPVSALASTTNGGSWLNVTPVSGTTPVAFSVSIVPAGLVPGTYNGTITISATDSLSGEVQVPVTLTVAGALDPIPTPSSLSFFSLNRTPPAPQQLTITRPDAEALIITAQTNTPPDLPWVQISLTPPGSTTAVWTDVVNVPAGVSDVVLYARPDPARVATLPFGSYTGLVRLTTAAVPRSARASAKESAERAASPDRQTSGRTIDVPVTLEIVSRVITLRTQCPSVIPNIPFIMPVTVTGGTGTYSLTLSGPPGVTLSSATGAAGTTPFVTSVTGRVQNVGSVPITITATDDSGSTPAVSSCSIAAAFPEPIVTPITFAPGANCPAGDFVVASPVTAALTASGGNGSFDFTADNLPPGLLLMGNTITGAPNTAGTYTYTLRVASGAANPVALRCTVRVQPGPLQIRTSCPTDARQGSSYSFPIIASGGLGGSSYEISINGLPAGLVATRGGIGGVPTGDPGSYNLTIQVRSGEQVVTQSCPITVNDPLNRPPAPQGSISCPESIPSGTPVNIAVNASGSGALSYRIEGPEWLQVQAGSGGATISGTAGAAGTYAFAVIVSDASGGTRRLECSVVVTPRPLAITGGDCPGPVTAGSALDLPLSVTGGTAPFRWEFRSTAPGVALGVSAGTSTRISGTPTDPGEYPFTVAVIDGTGARREFSCTLRVVAAPLTITGEGCPTGPVTRPVTINAPLTAAGGAGGYSWQLSGAPWLSLSANTGQSVAVTGNPPASGNFEFTATLTDAAGTPQTAYTCRFTVSAITPPTLQISGLSASLGASESGDLQLQLGAPAPVPLTATVTLIFIPDVVLPGVTDNPLVQFTGGRQRTLTVTIPAGQQTVSLGARAVLGNIAGTVRVVLSSLLDVTQELIGTTPPTAEFRVARQAPVIESVTFDRTGIVIRGFSNTLDMQSVTLAFQPASGGEIDGPSSFTFSNEVQEYFRQFFQNRNTAAGSAFQVRFPITLEGDNNGIAAVVVTLRNSAGETATQPVPLR